jgi:hypothetical protein
MTTLSHTERAGKQYLAALEAQRSAEKAVELAKELLQQSMSTDGTNEVTVEGKRIQAVEAIRRNFHADILEGLVTASVFREVTKVSVEPKAFDKALKNGIIDLTIEEQVMTPTPYTRIVVAEAKLAEEALVA